MSLFRRLPLHMMKVICLYLPPVDDTKPQDLTEQPIDCRSFHIMLHRCSELCNLITNVVVNRPQRTKSQLAPEDCKKLQVSIRCFSAHKPIGVAVTGPKSSEAPCKEHTQLAAHSSSVQWAPGVLCHCFGFDVFTLSVFSSCKLHPA